MNKLMIGIAREIITPKVGGNLYGYSPNVYSTKIEDDLTSTAFYFEYGKQKALLISITVCEISTVLCGKIRRLIQNETGVPKENIMLCATHTHSAPNVAGTDGWGDIDAEYCESIFMPALVSVSKKAALNTKHASVGIAYGESLVGVNRRETMADGRVDFGQDINAPFNPRMTVISFKGDDGKILANLIHYGAHGTAAGCNTEVTRDWPGVMTDALEAHTGAVTAFINGTIGDAGPRLSNGKTVGSLKYVYELGKIAAADAIRIYDGMKEYVEADFTVSQNEVRIPYKKIIPLEEARKIYGEYGEQSTNVGGLIRAYAKKIMELYEKGNENREYFSFGQTVIKLSDIILVGYPFEIFCNIGKNVDDSIQSHSVLSVCNVNGFEGYFATEDEVPKGGYEILVYLYSRPWQFCENADKILSSESTANIEKTIQITEDTVCSE